jgi:hypothetical protein
MKHMEIESQSVASTSGSGRWLVVALLFLGALAGGFAWWWNFNRGRRTLEFFGSEAARLIRTAPSVEFLKPPPENHVDLSRATGLINARASLLSDASYEWDQSPSAPGSPLFTVRFAEGERSVDVTFDFENRTLRTSSSNKAVVLKEKTARGWQDYLARHAGTMPPEPARTDPSE